jgi:hypothetical protein
MEESGHPDKCVKPSDRLVSVNGKTSVKEMTAELAHKEVRLEFTRSLQQREAAQDASPVQQWQPPANARLAAAKVPQGTVVQTPLRGLDSQKAKFGEALPAYLEACNPPDKKAFGLGDDLDEPWCGTDVQDFEELLKPDAKEEFLSKADWESGSDTTAQDFQEPLKLGAKEEFTSNADWEFGSDTTADELEARIARETPCSVVVQVLSLGAGTLRLSWCFDWTVAPADFLEEPGFLRSFEVIRQRRGDAPEEVRTSCKQALLKLDVPVGFCYSFVVRAVIRDVAKNGDDVAWASESSQPVAADLRGQSRPGGHKGVGPPHTVDAAAMRGTVQLPRPPQAVASGLGAFLQKVSRPPAAAADVRPLDTSDVSIEAAERVSSASSPEKAPAVVMGPVIDLSMTAKPLVVVGGNLDPAAEKRNIADRLQLRRAGCVAVSLEATANLERQRSLSMDSDDEGSLMRLSTALSTLEKAVASQSQRRIDAAKSVVNVESSGNEELVKVPTSPSE